MLTFTFAISYLTAFNFPWFMDLIFWVPMQYCSLQHWTLLLLPVTSTTGFCFCFGSIPSFFLELFLHWSPVAYWAPTDLGGSSFSILSFCLFILFMGFSRQEYWSGFPFPSPVDHILSDLSTMTRPSWVAPRAWLSFIELDKAVVLVWLDCLVFWATPHPRSGGCAGAGGLRGAIPRSRSGGAAVRRYPSSKVRSSGCAFLEEPWRDSPRPR